MQWLAAIPVLFVLSLTHELGHFFFAKRANIRVEEFGFGVPPRLWSVKRGETRYSLNLIPAIAFVKLYGEDNSADGERTLNAATAGQRALIYAAGPFLNFILGVLLFSVVLMMGVPAGLSPQVASVVPGSAADKSGMLAGDTIVQVDGKPIKEFREIRGVLEETQGHEVAIVVRRGNTEIPLKMTPTYSDTDKRWMLGVVGTAIYKSYLPWDALRMGFQDALQFLVAFPLGIIGMIQGSVAPDMAGAVGIAQATGEVASTGLNNLIYFAGFLSVNLAILNLLPLPALDGGRLVFVAVEALRRGKRIDPKKEGMVHLVGMVMLLGLFFVLTYNDILRIIQGGSLLR